MSETTEPELPPTGTPLGSVMTWLADRAPQAPSVTCDGVAVTRGELEAWANRLARVYRDHGVGLGDMVTIALGNSPEFVAATLATWKLGAIPQPVSSKLPLRERQAIVELADSRLVVGIEPGQHGERTCVPAGFVPATDIDAGPLAEIISPSWKAPTSGGSTGRPKLIVAGQAGRFDPLATHLFSILPGRAQLVPGPMYHNAPFLFASLGVLTGQHVVLMPRFDAEAALDAIERFHVDLANVVPTMMTRMLRAIESSTRTYDLGSLRRLWHMAAPCPDWLKRAWIDLIGPERIFELYGGTEAQAVCVIDGTQWLEHPGSVGRPVTGEMVVLGPDGEPLPAGGIGEIYMRTKGDRSTYRYIGAETQRRGEWESIGDMGSMDNEGFVYLADRRKDLILSGGANVYPAEVEGALLEHPAVGSCAVIGLPDDDLGQVVHAVVHLVGIAGEPELRDHLAERLVRYKQPRSWEFTSEPVRDDAGKVRRSALASDRVTTPPPAPPG